MDCSTAIACTSEYIHLAQMLASGRRLALGQLVLSAVCRGLFNITEKPLGPSNGPIWILQIWAWLYFPDRAPSQQELVAESSYGILCANVLPKFEDFESTFLHFWIKHLFTPDEVLFDAHEIVSEDRVDAPYKIPPFTAESSQSFDTWWLSCWASAMEDTDETIVARLAPPTFAKKRKKSTPTPASQDDVVAFHNSIHPATIASNQATTSNKVTKSKEVAVESNATKSLAQKSKSSLPSKMTLSGAILNSSTASTTLAEPSTLLTLDSSPLVAPTKENSFTPLATPKSSTWGTTTPVPPLLLGSSLATKAKKSLDFGDGGIMETDTQDVASISPDNAATTLTPDALDDSFISTNPDDPMLVAMKRCNFLKTLISKALPPSDNFSPDREPEIPSRIDLEIAFGTLRLFLSDVHEGPAEKNMELIFYAARTLCDLIEKETKELIASKKEYIQVNRDHYYADLQLSRKEAEFYAWNKYLPAEIIDSEEEEEENDEEDDNEDGDDGDA
ncbi:hypothetical protein CCACVL1_22651 [Corchorus capsularis]|uniref:Uncharacterized protein n=1 Tax=Corchorus capsularis TaxID=210143 RepID=A0A1R3GXD9_COCAP|nr:hypothetical protein CCACVL1_22651 [Corchorus capsularis]